MEKFGFVKNRLYICTEKKGERGEEVMPPLSPPKFGQS
jgi:hypothetical protein